MEYYFLLGLMICGYVMVNSPGLTILDRNERMFILFTCFALYPLVILVMLIKSFSDED